MTEQRIGRQTPTQVVALPYSETRGQLAVDLYEKGKRTCWEWQKLLLFDIMAVDEEGLWKHPKFGYSVPRRNGKNEIVAIRELWGILNGEKVMHTAHRTTTSHSAWERLCGMLERAGYKINEDYKATAQYGLETITMLHDDGGRVHFRTRSSKGGLGEGVDLLVIDEAQEYTKDQQTALQYIVTDSKNPQTLMCGTPPTTVSIGTVFTELRGRALSGETKSCGWAEWSTPHMSDVRNREIWYETNPSLGQSLTERNIAEEDNSDEVDFNIQRLGLWLLHNQKSAISQTEWEEVQLAEPPAINKRLFAGVKYGIDGNNVAVSIASRTANDGIFVEAIDCRSIRDGTAWVIDALMRIKAEQIIIDGSVGQNILAKELTEHKIKGVILPTVKEVIASNAMFEQAIFQQEICHMGQPSLTQSVCNCEKRAIGTSGGFGYKSIKEGVEIALLESVALAHWACHESKERRHQIISY